MFAWEQRKLGEILSDLYNGQTPSRSVNKYWKGNIPWLTSGELNHGIVENTVEKISESGKRAANLRMIPSGTIVIAITGLEAPGTRGNCAILGIDTTINQSVMALFVKDNIDTQFIFQWYKKIGQEYGIKYTQGTKQQSYNYDLVKIFPINIPTATEEQEKIGKFFKRFDSLITLHQRKPFIKNGGIKMITSNFTCDSLFKDYFEFWIKLYKEGAVRPVTLEKYRNNQKHIAKIIPNLKMKDFDRNAYQELLNQYALTHERQTVIDFHHQVKGAILDAVDDGLIDRDPTRKAIFKGKAPREKKQKYLNQFELHNLLEDLDLGMEITWDWLILLIAKTGLRFSEALGLTPADFDFARQTISVNKTWDYKTNTGFQPTKNRSSIRKVQMDWQLGMQFQHLIKNLNEDEPIFVNGPVCNSTPNNCLARHCRKCGIPEISIHGLRHTHASLLMFAGVSIASVSRRLGHSSITTTQKVYMHIISELENQDNDLVMRYLSSLS